MPPKKKATNGYKFAEPLPKGIILEDLAKKRWRLGPSIGKGGFGEIYSAQEESAKGEKYPYVIKIEPHANGPLFVEINFYIRHAKPAEIENFKKEKSLKTFGMPVYHGSGSHEYKGEKYRFLVMDKLAADIHKMYIENNKEFPVDTVFKIGLQIIDVLEYIHQRGYVHADIKGANILLGATKETQNKQVYLVDFGLASKFTMDKELKPNPKKAHDGTIEFLSRDAHLGVQTRRGDLEILAYNLIQWLGCKLPWENNLSDPKVVQKSKEDNMTTVPKMIKACFAAKSHPQAIADYLIYLKSLKFDTEPDYKKIRSIFTFGVKEGGGSVGTPLQFSPSKTPSKRTRTPLANSKTKKVKSIDEQELEMNGDETPKPKKRGRSKKEVPAEPVDEMEQQEIDDINPDSELTPVGRKKYALRRKLDNLDTSPSAITTSENSDYENKTEKQKRPARKKRLVARQNNELSDVEMTSASESESSAYKFAEVKRKGQMSKKSSSKRTKKTTEACMSENESGTGNNSEIESDSIKRSDPFHGYTEAMKEIMLKKKEKDGRKKRPNKAGRSEPDIGADDSDMLGYTDEMKAIAIKKKSKGKNATRSDVPIATTSKASSKRGIVKADSRRLNKRYPKTHGEVVDFSDESASE